MALAVLSHDSGTGHSLLGASPLDPLVHMFNPTSCTHVLSQFQYTYLIPFIQVTYIHFHKSTLKIVCWFGKLKTCLFKTLIELTTKYITGHTHQDEGKGLHCCAVVYIASRLYGCAHHIAVVWSLHCSCVVIVLRSCGCHVAVVLCPSFCSWW